MHNKYEVLCVVGEGAYGIVYKCRNKETNEIVAIKKFKEIEDEIVIKTMKREVKVLQILKHENIVEFKEAFKRKNNLFIVFEYVEKTLLDLLEEKPNGLDHILIKQLIYQLCKAVKYLHDQNIIHRDVKPENLLIKDGKILKLCDFGFARRIRNNKTEILTDYVATRWYRSPELLISNGVYGPEVDYWAIGCIMGEITDGNPLFPGENDTDQLHCIQKILGNFPESQVDMFYKNPLFNGKKLLDVDNPETLEKRYMGKLPKNAIKFMKGLLELDPEKRLCGDKVFQHPYFACFAEHSFNNSSTTLNNTYAHQSSNASTNRENNNVSVSSISINSININNIKPIHLAKNLSIVNVSNAQYSNQGHFVYKGKNTDKDEHGLIQGQKGAKNVLGPIKINSNNNNNNSNNTSNNGSNSHVSYKKINEFNIISINSINNVNNVNSVSPTKPKFYNTLYKNKVQPYSNNNNNYSNLNSNSNNNNNNNNNFNIQNISSNSLDNKKKSNPMAMTMMNKFPLTFQKSFTKNHNHQNNHHNITPKKSLEYRINNVTTNPDDISLSKLNNSSLNISNSNLSVNKLKVLNYFSQKNLFGYKTFYKNKTDNNNSNNLLFLNNSSNNNSLLENTVKHSRSKNKNNKDHIIEEVDEEEYQITNQSKSLNKNIKNNKDINNSHINIHNFSLQHYNNSPVVNKTKYYNFYKKSQFSNSNSNLNIYGKDKEYYGGGKNNKGYYGGSVHVNMPNISCYNVEFNEKNCGGGGYYGGGSKVNGGCYLPSLKYTNGHLYTNNSKKYH